MSVRFSRALLKLATPILGFGLFVVLSGCPSSPAPNPTPNPQPQPIHDYGQEEEERPPVIITSGGSIYLEAQEWRDKMGNTDAMYGRGKFTKDAKDFYHEHKKKAPVKFDVFLVFAACKGPQNAPYNVDNVEIDYSYKKLLDSGTASVTISTDKTYMRIAPSKFDKATVVGDYRLVLHEGYSTKIDKVVLDKGGGAGKEIECTLAENPAASVTIYQKKQ